MIEITNDIEQQAWNIWNAEKKLWTGYYCRQWFRKHSDMDIWEKEERNIDSRWRAVFARIQTSSLTKGREIMNDELHRRKEMLVKFKLL
tara:strand:+ start:174 stop:440 length:267 start_codon:yes stop_codon:yes gene_type:complete